MKTFKLPDLGEGLPDAEIHEWLVNEGDTVAQDQPMVSMETAKAVVEVPAPRAGTIAKLHGKVGDIIPTGSPLVEFTDGEESEHNKSSTVVGAIEETDKVLDEPGMGIQPKAAGNAIQVIPAVRALAQKLNVDLTQVTGTGPNGRITAADVQRAKQHSTATKSTTSTSTTAISGATPLRGVRRAMALSMTQSHQEVVPVTLVDDADIHAWPETTDITLRVIRAISAGIQAQPELNAWFDTASLASKQLGKIDLGIAMDSTEGLFLPVLRDIDQQSASALREKINQFKQQVKARSIPTEDLRDPSIILSNFGTFAGRYATPVIVPPCVAIIGTGRIREQAVVIDGKVAAHRVLPLSLTVDHRAITGGEAARFLHAVIESLEKPE
jgi:2-oxoisovalerate dehydrogenase E2 component (dihydrolipoyl transacylase)